MNFVHRACKVVLRVDELSILVVGQHIAQLTNGKLTECFVIAVFLRDDILVHVVGGIAHDLPDAVGLDFKFHRVGGIIEIAFRTLKFLNQVSAQRQFFGCFHKAVCIGVEHIRFLGGVAAGRVDHGNAGLAVFFVQPIQPKGCVCNFDRLAGFCIGLDELQIALQFLIQHIKSHIIVAGGGDAARRNREAALRTVGVHRHDERVALKHIFRDSGFYYQILPIRQTPDTEDTLIVREHFSQPILSGLIRGHPAVAPAVGVVTVCGQGGVIGVDRVGAALEHIGDGLSLGGEIVLERQIIVVILAVGVQNALCIVAAVRVLLELRRLAQFRDAINGKARTLQLQCRAWLTGGRNQLLQTKAGFQHFVLAFLFGMDVVGGFICIGQRFVVVDLIAEIPFGVGQVIPIPRFAAVQLAALGHSRILVFVDVVGILVILPSQITVLTCAFELFVQKRILPGNIQLAVSVNGQHQPGGTFHKVISAHIQVDKRQLAVSDFGRGYQPVFLQNR